MKAIGRSIGLQVILTKLGTYNRQSPSFHGGRVLTHGERARSKTAHDILIRLTMFNWAAYYAKDKRFDLEKARPSEALETHAQRIAEFIPLLFRRAESPPCDSLG
jgi:hypothetical protein